MLDKFFKKSGKKLSVLIRPVRKYLRNRQVLKEIRIYTGQKITKVDGVIYVIGDSHSNFFSGEENIISIRFSKGIKTGSNLISFFKTFHIGPALAFNLARVNTTTKALEKIRFLVEKHIPPRAAILLCFGEIDCRLHIPKQIKMNDLSREEAIDRILDNYFSLINELKKQGYVIICWGPIASQKDCWGGNSNFPRYGTERDRNIITRVFNEKLEDRCKDNRVKFCSIFKNLISENYLTIEKYISDQCHLSQTAMRFAVRELIDKQVILIDVDKKKAMITRNN